MRDMLRNFLRNYSSYFILLQSKPAEVEGDKRDKCIKPIKTHVNHQEKPSNFINCFAGYQQSTLSYVHGYGVFWKENDG